MQFKKTILFITGWLAVIVGAVALLLPVIPTTPFLLLAAVCFSYSSPRVYRWLCKLPYFGHYIQNYQTKRGVPLKSKIIILAFMWVGLSVSAILIGKLWLAIVLWTVAMAVTVHIFWLKTAK